MRQSIIRERAKARQSETAIAMVNAGAVVGALVAQVDPDAPVPVQEAYWDGDYLCCPLCSQRQRNKAIIEAAPGTRHVCGCCEGEFRR